MDGGGGGRVVTGAVGNPLATPEQARQALLAKHAELLKAAEDWGVRAEDPEGRFVTTMIATQAGFADLALALWQGLERVQERSRATAATELQQLTQANRQVQMQLQQVDAVRAAFSVKAEQAAAEMIDRLVPEISKGVSQAVVVKQLRHNQAVQWGRATGIAAAVLGLMLVSYGWRAYQDSPAAAAIERCLETRVNDTKTGKGYCPVESLLPAPS